MIAQAQVENRTLLTEIEAKEMLSQAGIPVVKTVLARNQKEAVSIAREMGFPVALKIVSQDISHKSDMGGVKLKLTNATQIEKAYQEIMASVHEKMPNARIEGVSVQKMAKSGVELIIGVNQDPQFGPMIMFGLGGVLVEILKDVSFRLIPLSSYDAAEMVKEIKGSALLKGYRGQEPVNIPALEEVLLKVSRFIENNPQVKELDLNPIFGYKDGLVAVDARIVLKQ